MPKTIEELEKLFEKTQSDVDLMRKDFQIKLDQANSDAKQYQELAKSAQEALKKFQEDSKKAEEKRVADLAKAKESEIHEFVESKVKMGIIVPAIKEKIMTFMKTLGSEAVVAEFAEADGKKISHNQISLFKEIISQMKPAVQVGKEVSFAGYNGTESPEGGSEKETQFMEVRKDGQTVKLPVADLDLHEKTLEYVENQKKAGVAVSYGDALIAVSKSQKKF